jgi:hypothetical protein
MAVHREEDMDVAERRGGSWDEFRQQSTLMAHSGAALARRLLLMFPLDCCTDGDACERFHDLYCHLMGVYDNWRCKDDPMDMGDTYATDVALEMRNVLQPIADGLNGMLSILEQIDTMEDSVSVAVAAFDPQMRAMFARAYYANEQQMT